MYGSSKHRQRVLVLLVERQARGATTAEICDPTIGGEEGTRRVRELRELGYPIMATALSNGYWKYWLKQPNDRVGKQGSLFDG